MRYYLFNEKSKKLRYVGLTLKKIFDENHLFINDNYHHEFVAFTNDLEFNKRECITKIRNMTFLILNERAQETDINKSFKKSQETINDFEINNIKYINIPLLIKEALSKILDVKKISDDAFINCYSMNCNHIVININYLKWVLEIKFNCLYVLTIEKIKNKLKSIIKDIIKFIYIVENINNTKLIALKTLMPPNKNINLKYIKTSYLSNFSALINNLDMVSLIQNIKKFKKNKENQLKFQNDISNLVLATTKTEEIKINIKGINIVINTIACKNIYATMCFKINIFHTNTIHFNTDQDLPKHARNILAYLDNINSLNQVSRKLKFHQLKRL